MIKLIEQLFKNILINYKLKQLEKKLNTFLINKKTI